MQMPGLHLRQHKDKGEGSEGEKSASKTSKRKSESGPNHSRASSIDDSDLASKQAIDEHDKYTHGEAHATSDPKQGEVLSIWPEGPDLVVERARGEGPCEDVDVEVLRGAAERNPELAGKGRGFSSSTSPTSHLRERAYAHKCALQERIEEIKEDLTKRL